MNSKSEIKRGVILSYLLLFINMAYGLMMTPFILNHVGSLDFGVYKSISSLSASLAVLDLGLGATMTRYMSKYNAENEHDKAENFAAMVFVQYFIIAGTIFIIGLGILFSLDFIYADKFSEESIALAKQLMLFLVFNMVLRLFENLLTGIANGYERFVFSNGVRMFSVLTKIFLVFIFLPTTKDVRTIVIFETIITLIAIAILIWYLFKNIRIIPRLVKWEKELFRESLGYTSLMFLQTVTIQFNGNVDNVLIGAQLGAASVTVYSMALQVFGMYQNLSGSIANIMLPNITRKITNGQSVMQLQNTVERCGRMQFMILGAALGGFIVLGQDFFLLWLGKGYEDCYYITLLLIIPVTFTMMQNVSLSILRAYNKMVYRTITLVISCAINIVITLVGLNFFGYWGAAMGTAAATISNLIFMNIYYHVKLHFRVFLLFKNVMERIFSCVVITTTIMWLFHMSYYGTWASFIINMTIYLMVYAVLLFSWGLKQEEKELLLGRIMIRRK